MIGRVVEIAEDGRHLSVHRGFMVVESEGRELGRLPLDDVGVVVANAHGITYSNTLLVKLAERGAAVVLCGANHMPVAWLWPLDAHHVQAARMRAQLGAARPLCKRLWQIVVRTKVLQQGAVLAALGRPSGGFRLLASRDATGHACSDPTSGATGVPAGATRCLTTATPCCARRRRGPSSGPVCTRR